MGADAGAGPRVRGRRRHRVRLAHGQRATAAAPGRDPRIPRRPRMPAVPVVGIRRCGAQPSGGRYRRQHGPALEPRPSGAAHCPRLAQASDPPGHRHQPGERVHHRASHAGAAGRQAHPRRGRARSARRPLGDPLADGPGRVHGAAQRGTRRTGGRRGGCRGRRCGRRCSPGAHRRRAALRRPGGGARRDAAPGLRARRRRGGAGGARPAARGYRRGRTPPRRIHGAERQGDRSGDPRIDAPPRRSGADRVAGG